MQVDVPDMKGRKEILQVHAKNKKLDPEVDLEAIAARTPGFSGADLANLLNEVHSRYHLNFLISSIALPVLLDIAQRSNCHAT